MTLFSASRYCGMQTNKGAFLSMRSDLQPEIQQYYAHSIKVSPLSMPATATATSSNSRWGAVCCSSLRSA
jgi:hypothetical protein